MDMDIDPPSILLIVLLSVGEKKVGIPMAVVGSQIMKIVASIPKAFSVTSLFFNNSPICGLEDEK
jgi:hypothetical protein